MSLSKAIKYKKEYRKPYHGSKEFDHTCRNHGSCYYCMKNRTYNSKKKILQADKELKNNKLNIL